MLNEVTSAWVNNALGNTVKEAVNTGNVDRIQAVASLMTVVSQARNIMLETLEAAGFEDVPLATPQEEEAIKESGIRETLVLEAQPSSNFLNGVAAGFVEASYLVGHRFANQTPDNPMTIHQALGQVQAVGRAWAAFEAEFDTDRGRESLTALDLGTDQQKVQTPETGSWVSAMVDAAKAARANIAAQKPTPEVPEEPKVYQPAAQTVEVANAEFAAAVFAILKEAPTLDRALRRRRLNRDETQSETAGRQFSVSYMSAVERGQINPSIGALQRIVGGDIERAIATGQLTPEIVAFAIAVLNPPHKPKKQS